MPRTGFRDDLAGIEAPGAFFDRSKARAPEFAEEKFA
jgi:hypothetical protein